MKYKIEDYINSGFYEETDADIVNHKIKIVKCKKNHQCVNCKAEIKIGDNAYFEKGFMHDEPVSCYTCISCIDIWLDFIKSLEEVKE